MRQPNELSMNKELEMVVGTPERRTLSEPADVGTCRVPSD